MNAKLFWGAADVGNYIGVSTSTAYKFVAKIKQFYAVDQSRCPCGKVPSQLVIEYFSSKQIKKMN